MDIDERRDDLTDGETKPKNLPTRNDVRAALVAARQRTTFKRAHAILRRFGATVAPIKEQDRRAVIAAAGRLL